jgi:hypothetical protein
LEKASMTSPYKLWAARENLGQPYIVCAMFTESYRDKAERLQASLRASDIEYALYEVPAVHRSIVPGGTGDLSLSKPPFIRFALDHFRKKVLYVDADVCFRSVPELFASLKADFAVFNWLASDATDAWAPMQMPGAVSARAPRFYAFSFAIDQWSKSQMFCSGCVQWWTPNAHALLDRWQDVIAANPRAQDDHCLDVAFNFRPADDLRFAWLPKEYARCAFWIFTQPVIDHPEFPALVSRDFDEIPGGRAITSQIDFDTAKHVPVPRSIIIDTRSGALLAKNAAGQYATTGQLQMPLYLPAA